MKLCLRPYEEDEYDDQYYDENDDGDYRALSGCGDELADKSPKCQNYCDLRAFLGVKFGLKDLICVNKLTFRNSAVDLRNVTNVNVKFLSIFILTQS